MKKPLLLLTFSGFIGLAGCEDAGQKTQAGAALGGAVGVLSGLLTDDNAEGTIKRAAIGAAIGGAIGYALDKQEADLRRELEGSGAQIRNTGSELIVTLPENITFATNSTYVRERLQRGLRRLAYNLQEYPNSDVDVIGHTDSVGSSAYNQELSSRRAHAVSEVLIDNGIPPYRIRAYGRGEISPIASNRTEGGRSENRRVEVIIFPNESS